MTKGEIQTNPRSNGVLCDTLLLGSIVSMGYPATRVSIIRTGTGNRFHEVAGAHPPVSSDSQEARVKSPRTAIVAAAVLVAACMAHPVWAAGDSRIADAAQKRDAAGVRQLLKTADVNGSQPDGATALAWAAHWDDVVLADLLLAAGANPNAANELGVTPLMLAAVNGSDRMTERLLKAGGKADAARDGGASVLMLAARSGNLAVVKTARRRRR